MGRRVEGDDEAPDVVAMEGARKGSRINENWAAKDAAVVATRAGRAVAIDSAALAGVREAESSIVLRWLLCLVGSFE